MKKLILLFIFFFTIPLYAQDVTNPPLNVTEEDGSPSTYPYQLKFENGAVTDNGDSTTSIEMTGAGYSKGTGNPSQVAYWNGDTVTIAGSDSLVFINSTSRLGVGVSNPQTILHVASNLNSGTNQLRVVNNSTGSSAWAGLRIDNDTGSMGYFYAAGSNAATGLPYENTMVVESDPNSDGLMLSAIEGDSVGLFVGGKAMVWVDGSSTLVGIGTTAPSVELDVNGSADVAGYLQCKNFVDTSHYTGFPNTTDTSLSWDDGTYTLTLTASDDLIWIDGVEYGIDTLTKQLTAGQEAATGLYWFWITAPSGVPQLNCDTTVTDQFAQCLTATVYWNTTTSKGLLSDERHWMGRDKWMHEYLHETVGARYAEGMAGTFNDATFEIAAGEFYDEDLEHINVAETVATVLYHDGDNDWAWDTATATPYKEVNSNLVYNDGTTLTEATANRFVNYYFFITPDEVDPVHIIIGTAQYTTAAGAKAEAVPSFGSLPSAENKLIYRVTYKNSATIAWEDTTDYRTSSTLPSTGYVATDHGALAGLTDDDHTQYWIHTTPRTQDFHTSGTLSAANLGIGTTAPVGILNAVGTTNTVAITAGGFVGIGNTAPANMLYLQNSNTLNMVKIEQDATLGGEEEALTIDLADNLSNFLLCSSEGLGRVKIDGNGRVGINTGDITLTRYLTVKGSGTQFAFLDAGDATVVSFADNALTFNQPSNFYSNLNANHTFAKETNVLYSANGSFRVGIGTTNPIADLHVEGTLYAARIGVGISAPATDFQVVGTASIDTATIGTLTVNNTLTVADLNVTDNTSLTDVLTQNITATSLYTSNDVLIADDLTVTDDALFTGDIDWVGTAAENISLINASSSFDLLSIYSETTADSSDAVYIAFDNNASARGYINYALRVDSDNAGVSQGSHHGGILVEGTDGSGGASAGIRIEDDFDIELLVVGGSVDVAGTIDTNTLKVDEFAVVDDYLTAAGGIHVGGTSDPQTNNLIVDGKSTLTGSVYIGNSLHVAGNVGIGVSAPARPKVHIFDGASGATTSNQYSNPLVLETNETRNTINFRGTNSLSEVGFVVSTVADSTATYLTWGMSSGTLGTCYLSINGDAAGDADVRYDTNSTAITYDSSTLRTKDNVAPFELSKKLKDKYFTLDLYGFNPKGTDKFDIGLIAEYTEKTFPEMVLYEYVDDPDYEGIPPKRIKTNRPETVKYDWMPLFNFVIIKEYEERLNKLEALYGSDNQSVFRIILARIRHFLGR